MERWPMDEAKVENFFEQMNADNRRASTLASAD